MSSDDDRNDGVLIYDRASIDTHGRTCETWRESADGTMDTCGNPASWVFVYQQSNVPGYDSRGNCLACPECVPEVTDV